MFVRFFDYLLRVSSIIAGTVLIGMVVSINVEVFLRYFFNRPTIWAADATSYGLIYATFIPAAWVLLKEGHTKVEIIVDRLQPRLRHLVIGITSFVGGFVSAVFCYFSLMLTLRSIESGHIFAKALVIPRWPVQIVMPLGTLLLTLQFFISGFHHISRWRIEEKGDK
jgi:TRAP-type C4-dicarboxylate transport system permease small subunit